MLPERIDGKQKKFSEPVFAMPFNNTKNETERCSEAEPYQNESIDGSLNSSSSESSEFDYLLDSFQPNQKEIHPKNDIRNIPVDQSKYREMLLKHGFTFYIDVIPDDVESLVEQYPFVLVHFSPEKSALSTSLDIFLNCKAAEYLGTRFIRVSASSSSALSFCGLRDGFVSGLASFRDGVCVSRSHGLRQFGVNTVDSNAVKQWLEYSNILKIDPLPSTFFSNFRSDQLKLDSSDDEEELEISRRYNCGRNGCNKPFVHEHVDTSLSKKVKIIAPGLGNSRESILS